jgi:hypothetical protein
LIDKIQDLPEDVNLGVFSGPRATVLKPVPHLGEVPEKREAI